jgi:hypothetical protein
MQRLALPSLMFRMILLWQTRPFVSLSISVNTKELHVSDDGKWEAVVHILNVLARLYVLEMFTYEDSAQSVNTSKGLVFRENKMCNWFQNWPQNGKRSWVFHFVFWGFKDGTTKLAVLLHGYTNYLCWNKIFCLLDVVAFWVEGSQKRAELVIPFWTRLRIDVLNSL